MMAYCLLLLCGGLFGVLLGWLLGETWWYIELQLRCRMLRRLAASLNQMTALLENILERLYALAEEAEQRGGEECRQRQEM